MFTVTAQRRKGNLGCWDSWFSSTSLKKCRESTMGDDKTIPTSTLFKPLHFDNDRTFTRLRIS
jgi:hypothetical protein